MNIVLLLCCKGPKNLTVLNSGILLVYGLS